MFAFGHVFDRQSFLFLLDLEIRKARRYQNYLSVLSFTFNHTNSSSKDPSIALETLGNLLKDDLRDTDIIGQGGENRLFVMLPNIDVAETQKLRERLEQIIQDYGFCAKGLAVEINEVCFPTHATNMDELLLMAVSNSSRPHP